MSGSVGHGLERHFQRLDARFLLPLFDHKRADGVISRLIRGDQVVDAIRDRFGLIQLAVPLNDLREDARIGPRHLPAQRRRGFFRGHLARGLRLLVEPLDGELDHGRFADVVGRLLRGDLDADVLGRRRAGRRGRPA